MSSHGPASVGDLLEGLVETAVGDTGESNGIDLDGRYLESHGTGRGHVGNDPKVPFGRKRRVETNVDDGLVADVRDLCLESLPRIDWSRRLVKWHVDDGRRAPSRGRLGRGGDPLVPARSGVDVRVHEARENQVSGSIDGLNAGEGRLGGPRHESVCDAEPSGLQDHAIRESDVTVHHKVVGRRVIHSSGLIASAASFPGRRWQAARG